MRRGTLRPIVLVRKRTGGFVAAGASTFWCSAALNPCTTNPDPPERAAGPYTDLGYGSDESSPRNSGLETALLLDMGAGGDNPAALARCCAVIPPSAAAKNEQLLGRLRRGRLHTSASDFR